MWFLHGNETAIQNPARHIPYNESKRNVQNPNDTFICCLPRVHSLCQTIFAEAA